MNMHHSSTPHSFVMSQLLTIFCATQQEESNVVFDPNSKSFVH